MKCIILFGILLSGTFAAPSYKKPKFRGGLNKIVGGTEVTPGELPYQLSYQDLSLGQFYHYCGASIYNENWAICAGHCVNGEDMDNPDYLRVVAGEHNLDVEEGNEQAIVLSRIIQHEDYDSFNYGNDISVLQLSEPLVFNEFVQPIPLPEPGHAATGDCIVSGWGTTSEGGQSSSTLRKVSVPIITDMECRDIYDWSDVEDSMVCAGDLNGGRDACQGDSGGPLVCSDTGSSYLGGIVSWGYGCARPDFPGVYTEVAYFVDWVKANTE